MQWHEAIEQLKPYVVRIATPQGSGTGWVVSRTSRTNLCAIATASHVIDHAHYWDEPIRVMHFSSGKSVVLRPPERAIFTKSDLDSAGIVFDVGELPVPDERLPLVGKDEFIAPGVEIGWLGFPAIPGADLCFFSGRISAYLEGASAYLVDGVAINGVSGGPAFRLLKESPELLGVVSAYIPNRTGDVLPGVSVVRDTTEFHNLTQRIRSFDEAKKEESAPTEPRPGGPPESEKTTRTSG